MEKIFFFFLILFSFSIQAQTLTNCYTIAAGKDATQTGSVIIAHNEDDGGNLIVNLHKVPRVKHNETDYILTTGAKTSQIAETFELLWIETTQQNFGDFFMNQWGVTICSNACQSKEDTAIGHISYDFRKIIAERATNARHAVIIAGQLIDELGYASSGRTYCISDAYEVWIFAAVQGKHWVAQRVADDEIAIIPNYYTIKEIDLSDSLNFLGSDDIIDYAIDRKWYNPDSNNIFNFRLAYGTQKSLNAIWNIPRHWAGLNLLSDNDYSINDDFPFSFKTDKKVSINILKKVLSSHYENTDFEANTDSVDNPHSNKIHTICNSSTKFSVIVEFANTYPENNQNIIWFAPMNPCINPYIPIHFSIDSFPPQFTNRSWNNAVKYHFDETNNYENNPNHAYSIFNQQILFINEHYQFRSGEAKFQKQIFETEAKQKFIGNKKGEVSYQLLIKLYNNMRN